MGIIILTTYVGDGYVLEAIKARVRGYVLKSARAKELIETIRTMYRGRALPEPGAINTLLKGFRRLADHS